MGKQHVAIHLFSSRGQRKVSSYVIIHMIITYSYNFARSAAKQNKKSFFEFRHCPSRAFRALTETSTEGKKTIYIHIDLCKATIVATLSSNF